MSGRRIVDYHVHSNLSFDGSSTMFEICEKAVKLNMKEIGFTDHMDFNPRDLGYGFFEYEKYSSEIERARSIFGEKIIVRKGIEIDYQSRYEDDVRRWLGDKEFDYAIGSVHYINDENVRYLLRKRPMNDVLEDYVDEVLHSVKSGFNILKLCENTMKEAIKRMKRTNSSNNLQFPKPDNNLGATAGIWTRVKGLEGLCPRPG